MIAAIQRLYRAALPYRAANAGAPGPTSLASRRTLIDLSDLTRSARKAVIAQRRDARSHALFLGDPVEMTPHDILFADIRARRAAKGA